VRLGVGLHHRDVRDDPAVFVRMLLEDQAALRLGLDDAQLVETHRGLIPAEHTRGRLVDDGLLAVGDAASQATLVAGEGIRVAIESGELAGDVIVAALARGDVSREALLPYETESRRRLRGQAAVGARLNRRLATTSDDARWDRRVADLESMPPDLVVALLQSQLPLRRVAAWALRSPLAAARLVRSVTA
jgi:digeranylgeranylglycerophospholipid reductase